MSRSRVGISLVESEEAGICESPNKPGSDAAEQSEHAWHVANLPLLRDCVEPRETPGHCLPVNAAVPCSHEPERTDHGKPPAMRWPPVYPRHAHPGEGRPRHAGGRRD